MELVFDHSPVMEGASCLSGEPEPMAETATGDVDPEFYSSRPVAVEMRMDSFHSSAEVMPDADDSRSASLLYMQGAGCRVTFASLLLQA